MNKTGTALLAVAAIGLAATPSSAERPIPPRTVTIPYEVGVGIDCERARGCVMLVPRKGEKYVNFTVHDVSGARVYGTVTDKRRSSFKVFGDGAEFCGGGRYEPENGKPVFLYFENHLGSWHRCAGGASRGVVKAMFFRR